MKKCKFLAAKGNRSAPGGGGGGGEELNLKLKYYFTLFFRLKNLSPYVSCLYSTTPCSVATP